MPSPAQHSLPRYHINGTRTVAGLERILGLASRGADHARANKELESDDDADEQVEEVSASADSAARPDGKPLSLGEKILERLQAGFSPAQDPLLFEDVRLVITQTVEKAVKEYHIEVPNSVEMFIVPGKLSTFHES